LAVIGFGLSWWSCLVSCGLIAFLVVFLWKDIPFGLAVIPFLLVWLLSHMALAPWRYF